MSDKHDRKRERRKQRQRAKQAQHRRRLATDPEAVQRQMLKGPKLLGYTIGAWTPSPDGTGTPEAVALSLEVEWLKNKDPVNLVLRLKSVEAVDQLVGLLEQYKAEVFGSPV